MHLSFNFFLPIQEQNSLDGVSGNLLHLPGDVLGDVNSVGPIFLVDNVGSDDEECEGCESDVPFLPVAVSVDDGCDGKGHHGHELDENIEGRSGGVLEGITDGVSDDAGLVSGGTLSSAGTVDLDVLLGVVPGASGVGHHDGHHHAGCDGSTEHANEALGADEESNDKGREDGPESGEDHLLNGGLGGDGDAPVGVGLSLALHESGDLGELAADLDDNGTGSLLDGEHSEGGKEEGEHGTKEGTGEHDRLGNVSGGDTGLSLEGSEEGKRGEDGGSNGESLSGGSGGISEGIEGIGGLSDTLIELSHLGDSSSVVGNGAVGVGSEGNSESREHADGGDGDSVA